MKSIECFFIEPTGRYQRSLRRLSGANCPGRKVGGHLASIPIDQIEPTCDRDKWSGDLFPHDDPRWPQRCYLCDYVFAPDDCWMLDVHSLYRSADGREMGLNDWPPGAMYWADWMPPEWCGADGRSLAVVVPSTLPDGRSVWLVDSQANNCTKKHDKVHRCWIRHGQVPKITVDKAGNTCSAGAGSIQTTGWHGFLRNGVLVPC